MWRGLMLNRAVQHFLEDVRWGALDYLVIDLPPAQAMFRWAWPGCSRAPSCSSSRRRTKLHRRSQVGQPTWRAGDTFVSPASSRTCRPSPAITVRPTRSSDPVWPALADEIGVPLVGSVPLDARVATGGDAGAPVALDEAGPLAEVFAAIAQRIVTEVSPQLDMQLQRPLTGACRKGAWADRCLTVQTGRAYLSPRPGGPRRTRPPVGRPLPVRRSVCARPRSGHPRFRSPLEF